ncbi:hypothetical protein Golomagni_04311 [Golovinomyces magnicellulatus]|nr:hypothetical protein Golomagni_04311 [Golovinomyces magnicellulatus]
MFIAQKSNLNLPLNIFASWYAGLRGTLGKLSALELASVSRSRRTRITRSRSFRTREAPFLAGP